MGQIIDSKLTLSQALAGSDAPREILDQMCLVGVEYIGFDGRVHLGQIIVNRDLRSEVEEIFSQLKVVEFPIEKVIPVVEYDWSDEQSMLDNNSSGFNYRLIAGTDTLSKHAFGRAFDVNPKQNPYIPKTGQITSTGPAYNPTAKGTIVDHGPVVKIFESFNWDWGGHWGQARGYFDYHHFEKRR